MVVYDCTPSKIQLLHVSSSKSNRAEESESVHAIMLPSSFRPYCFMKNQLVMAYIEYTKTSICRTEVTSHSFFVEGDVEL